MQKRIIPELNNWIKKILQNNQFNVSYVDSPVEVSSEWNIENSVISVLFNETYKSSYPYFEYNYYAVDVNNTYDSKLNSRIQINKAGMYLYKCKTTTSDPVSSNIFDLTDEELSMINFLHQYKTTGGLNLIDWQDVSYDSLVSSLSKWIYLYLRCYYFKIIECDKFDSISENEDFLRTMYEKHAINRIYSYIQKQYCVIYNEITKLSEGNEVKNFTDYTISNRTALIKVDVSDGDSLSKVIDLNNYIPDNNPFKLFYLPTKNKDFECIYDGKILSQVNDYTISDIGSQAEPHIVVTFKINIEPGKLIQMMWGYAIPESSPPNNN